MKFKITAFLLLFATILNAQEKYTVHETDSLLQVAYTEDQAIRIQMIELNKRGSSSGFTPELVDSLVLVSEQTEQIDKKNIQLVAAVLKPGWPENLQDESYNAIWTIIDHADTKHQKKFFPMLKIAADKGTIPYSDLVTLKDRILMNSGKLQLYGTQSKIVVSDHNEPVVYIWPVKHPDQLNERRKSVGLTSIEEYVKLLESTSNTKAVYDPSITVKQLKRMSRNKMICK